MIVVAAFRSVAEAEYKAAPAGLDSAQRGWP
jgi:hypothetical protein